MVLVPSDYGIRPWRGARLSDQHREADDLFLDGVLH